MIKRDELGMLKYYAKVATTATADAISKAANLITAAAEGTATFVEKTSSAVAKAASSFSKMLEATSDAAKQAASALGTLKVVKDIFGLLAGDVTRATIGGSIKKGDDVAYAQSALNKIINANLVVDGIYGPKTNAAVQAFQRSKSLVTDGIVGPKTWAAIDEALGTSKPYSTAVAASVPVSVGSTTPIETSAHPAAVVAQGDKNLQVTQLQAAINKLGYPSQTGKTLSVDGIFGPATTEGVKWAQGFVGLPVTGLVDAATFNTILTSASKMTGTTANTPEPIKEAVAINTNVVSGTYPAALAEQIIMNDPSKQVMTKSRYANASANDTASGLLLDAVIAQFKASVQGSFFKFFNLLNPFIPAIIRALAYHETGVRNSLVGGAGEVSIFQFLPKTAASLASKYGLPPLNISNAASLAAYLVAIFKDQDAAAGNFIEKSISGSMNKGLPGNDAMTAVLGKLPSSPALISQLMAFFMIYNAGYSDTLWQQDWRAAEAYKRTLSVILAAGGY